MRIIMAETINCTVETANKTGASKTKYAKPERRPIAEQNDTMYSSGLNSCDFDTIRKGPIFRIKRIKPSKNKFPAATNNPFSDVAANAICCVSVLL